MGPPTVAPNWLSFQGGFVSPSKKFRAFSLSLRMYSQASPWSELVPDFVLTSVTEPALLPYCASKLLVMMRNSDMKSGDGWAFEPPLKPLLDTPSNRKPLKLARVPLMLVCEPPLVTS